MRCAISEVGPVCWMCRKFGAMFQSGTYIGAPMAISLDKLTGWWKLHDAWHEFDDAASKSPFGGSPTGSLVFTDDGRMMLAIVGSFYTAHSPGYDMEAHSGRFVLEGSEIITTVEFSSRIEWMHRGVRYFVSLGPNNTLHLTSRQVGLLYDGAPFTAASN